MRSFYRTALQQHKPRAIHNGSGWQEQGSGGTDQSSAELYLKSKVPYRHQKQSVGKKLHVSLQAQWRPGMVSQSLSNKSVGAQAYNNKGTPPWGGCGFSTIVYLVIESKITFLHCNLQYFMLVIYDVLTFAARCQNAKKKLLQFRNICLRFNAFFFSSVLFQSAFFVLKSLPKVWMYWCWCANLNCHDLTFECTK